jgi:hypothetical protein
MELKAKLPGSYGNRLNSPIAWYFELTQLLTIFSTSMAEHYEYRSVMLILSQWFQIVKDLMTTTAAIDRAIHDRIVSNSDRRYPATEPAKLHYDNIRKAPKIET